MKLGNYEVQFTVTPETGLTTAILFAGGQPLKVSTSQKGRKDTFDEWVGIKKAFTRLVSHLPRGERASLWAEFLATKTETRNVVIVTIMEGENSVKIVIDNRPNNTGGAVVTVDERGIATPGSERLLPPIYDRFMKSLMN